MGAHLGADADGLVSLAGRFASAATALDRLIDEIGSAVRSAWWRGRDADEFAAAWTGQAGVVGRVATVLRSAADELRRQATDQRRVSGDDPLAGSDLRSAARVADIAGPRPRVVRWVRAGLEFQVSAADAGESFVYRIDDLPDGTSQVSEMTRIDAGLQNGPDRRFEVWSGDHHVGAGIGAMAAVDASVAATSTWAMPTDDVDDFVRWRLVDGVTGGSFTPGASSGLGVLAPFLGAASSMISTLISGPGRTDGGTGAVWEGIGVGASARAGAGTAGQSSPARAAAAGDGRVDVVVSVRPADGAIAVDVGGAVAGGIHGRLLGVLGDSDAAGEGSARVRVVFDQDGTPVSLHSTTSEASDGRVTERHATVDLTTPDARAAVHAVGRAGRRLADAAGSGRVARFAPDAGRAVDAISAAALRLAPVAQARTDVFTVADVDSSGLSTPVVGIEYAESRWVREP